MWEKYQPTDNLTLRLTQRHVNKVKQEDNPMEEVDQEDQTEVLVEDILKRLSKTVKS